MGARASVHLLSLAAAVWLGLTSVAAAHDDLVDLLPPHGKWTSGFDGARPTASVRDGFLYGTGRERHSVLPNGRLRIERIKTYTRVQHPETRRLIKLREPWTVRQVLVLSPSLRLLSATTKLDFKKSIDDVLEGYRFSEEHERFFEWDSSSTQAVDGGTRLRRVQRSGKEVIEDETYDYPRDAVPIEIVGVALTAALQNRIDAFEYDLLLPGGSTHGVKVDVVRTRDLRPFAREYRLTGRFAKALQPGHMMAVMDMRLASPIKKLVFPHHFYMAYLADRPEQLVAFWGGKPGEHMYAFRTDDWRASLAAAPAPAATVTASTAR